VPKCAFLNIERHIIPYIIQEIKKEESEIVKRKLRKEQLRLNAAPFQNA
jgi:hypothetical protein